MNKGMQTSFEKTMSAGRRARDRAHSAFTDYLMRRLLAVNTTEMQKLSVMLYRLLGRGTPVMRDQLATACGISQERVAQLLLEFPPTTVSLDECGAVAAFGGMSLIPTHHRFFTKEVALYTWCVFDALFLPEILGQPATLITHCPGSGAELVVDLGPGEVRAARPSGCVMSIVTPDNEASCQDLRAAFCDHVNLFKDEQTLSAWSRRRHGVGCVTLQMAQHFARQRNALRYPDIELGTRSPDR